MLGEYGEGKLDTNVNFLLEEYGIFVNNGTISYTLCLRADAVIRTAYHKYHHPKECLVTNGIMNR